MLPEVNDVITVGVPEQGVIEPIPFGSSGDGTTRKFVKKMLTFKAH